MKTILIDSDIIAFRCAASCEPMSTKPEREPVHFAVARADELMFKILAECDTDQYKCFLSGGDNFRELLYPEYKANRKDKIRPAWLDECRTFLIKHWNAEVVGGYEADDAIGIEHNENTIIASIDKDFKQLPGNHYNFVKEEHFFVDDNMADYYFWKLMLVGDTADNVPGVAGIGEKKSEKILLNLTPAEREAKVKELYNDPVRFDLNKRLFRILRSKQEHNQLIQGLYEDGIS